MSGRSQISAEYFHLLHDFYECLGLSTESVFGPLQVLKSELKDPTEAISYDKALVIWKHLCSRRGQLPLGIMFANFMASRPPFLLAGRLMMNCRTIGEAFTAAGKIPGLWGDISMTLQEMPDTLGLVVRHIPEAEKIYPLIDTILAHCMNSITQAAQCRLPPSRVCFRHPAPMQPSFHHEFFGCTVEFGCEENMFVIPKEYMARAIPRADPVLGIHLKRLAQDMAKLRIVDKGPAPSSRREMSARSGSFRERCSSLENRFGLSPAEAELSVLLCGGMEVKAIADERGTSVRTTRHQLQNVFRKTGTKRQVELVQLFLTTN